MTKRTIESDLSLAILGLLSVQTMSGYDLRNFFLTTAMKTFSASPGAIYPALRRLENDGLIEGTIQKKDTLRPRIVYALTRQGRAVLVESLTRPVTREGIIWRRDRLLLRFSFMTGLVGVDETLVFLRAIIEETERYLEVLEAEFRESGSGLPFSGRAAFEHGIESYRTTVRWARKTSDKLKKLTLTKDTS